VKIIFFWFSGRPGPKCHKILGSTQARWGNREWFRV